MTKSKKDVVNKAFEQAAFAMESEKKAEEMYWQDI